MIFEPCPASLIAKFTFSYKVFSCSSNISDREKRARENTVCTKAATRPLYISICRSRDSRSFVWDALITTNAVSPTSYSIAKHPIGCHLQVVACEFFGENFIKPILYRLVIIPFKFIVLMSHDVFYTPMGLIKPCVHIDNRVPSHYIEIIPAFFLIFDSFLLMPARSTVPCCSLKNRRLSRNLRPLAHARGLFHCLCFSAKRLDQLHKLFCLPLQQIRGTRLHVQAHQRFGV